MPRLRWFLPGFILLIVGCMPVTAERQPQTRTLQPVSTPAPQATVYDACQPPAAAPNTRHQVMASVDYTARRASVQQQVDYINRTTQDLTQIVLNVEANRWRDAFMLLQVTQGASPLAYELDSKRLTVELPEPLRPNCETSLVLDFVINVPAIGIDVTAPKGYFGYTNRQMNLGHWLPTVAPLQGDVWISRQAFAIGEQEVLGTAGWSVTLELVGEQQDVTVAAPGVATQLSPTSWRYEHPDAREFAVSISDQFQLATATAANDVTVELYTFAVAEDGGAAAMALDSAVNSLGMFDDLFGAYPGERLLVVEGDFPDGMEFSGLVFVGSNWFVRYPGTPASYLTLITVHEVAHQWWYAQVGNDPAQNPWLDEALATYSELIYLEEYHPELRDWWWNFRVNAYTPDGFVDSSVYEFGSGREYINAVYLRGVRMLGDLRDDLGTEVFFQLLADYAAAGTGQIVTPEMFWAVMSPVQREMTQATRNEYLRVP
jgi:hypothetical protein